MNDKLNMTHMYFRVGDYDYNVSICSTPSSSFGIFFVCDDISLYAYICLEDEVCNDIHSILRVTYHTRSYANNKTLYNRRRELHNTDDEILTARLVDRAIRSSFPLINKKAEITILLVRHGGKFDVNIAAMMATNILCKLYFGSIFEFNLPIKVSAYNDNILVNNHTNNNSIFNCYMCINKKGISLIELSSNDSVHYNALCDYIEKVYIDYYEHIDKITNILLTHSCHSNIQCVNLTRDTNIEDILVDSIRQIVHDQEYKGHQYIVRIISDIAAEMVSAKYTDEHDIKRHTKYMCKNAFIKYYEIHKTRIDGRQFGEIRDIFIHNDYIQEAHGSAVLYRGHTIVLCNITVDDNTNRNSIYSYADNIYVHYNFHSFSVNEMSKYSLIKRREIGHGAIIKHSVNYAVLTKCNSDMRIVVEVLSSDGSSSMLGSMGAYIVCKNIGMNTKPIVGIGYGAIKINDEIVILKDINSIEDSYGLIDMKIIMDDSNNVIYIQLDSKETVVSVNMLRTILSSFQEDAKQYFEELNKQKSKNIHCLLQEQAKINMNDIIFNEINNKLREITEIHKIHMTKHHGYINIYGSKESIVIASMKIQHIIEKTKRNKHEA